MTVWPIVLWPDPRLKEAALPVGDTAGVSDLAEDMLSTMYAANGRGLAAPQIGVGRRIFVMDTGWKEGDGDPQVFIDPEITARSDVMIAGVEGCLSLPGIEAEVLRPEWIDLRWTLPDGSARAARMAGFDARCASHEIDHLDGLVTLDHQTDESRARLETAYAEGSGGVKRRFVPWPDQRLRTAAAPVGEITETVRETWGDMVETMDAMPGYGLAAPQIGVMLRLAVVDCSAERGRAILLADPEIISASSEMQTVKEASPNLPGVSAPVPRPAKVNVAFTDHHGMRVRQDFEALWATSVQHQIDHLQGRMFFDRLSRVKRQMLLKKAHKVAP